MFILLFFVKLLFDKKKIIIRKKIKKIIFALFLLQKVKFKKIIIKLAHI